MLGRYFIGSLSVHLMYGGKRGRWAYVYTMRVGVSCDLLWHCKFD